MVQLQNSQACLEACISCMEACNRCFNQCLSEQNHHELSECIRLDRECADMCAFAVRAIEAESPFAADICALCAEMCEACAKECRMHDHDHCQACAKACFICAEACRKMAPSRKSS